MEVIWIWPINVLRKSDRCVVLKHVSGRLSTTSAGLRAACIDWHALILSPHIRPQSSTGGLKHKGRCKKAEGENHNQHAGTLTLHMLYCLLNAKRIPFATHHTLCAPTISIPSPSKIHCPAQIAQTGASPPHPTCLPSKGPTSASGYV